MVFKGEKPEIALGCFKEQIRLKMLTKREKEFAEGIILFYSHHGYLTQNQFDRAWKMLQRLILERDIPL